MPTIIISLFPESAQNGHDFSSYSIDAHCVGGKFVLRLWTDSALASDLGNKQEVICLRHPQKTL